jgi:hypothetical protein
MLSTKLIGLLVAAGVVLGGVVAVVVVLTVGAGDSGSDDSTPADTFGSDFPFQAVKPPVLAVTPQGFKSSDGFVGLDYTITAEAISARFFTGGPSDILSVLANVDNTFLDLQTMAAERERACLGHDPVEYQMDAWGNNVTMYAQCVQGSDDDVSFSQFANVNDTSYWYSGGSAVGSIATIATNLGNGFAEVHVYLSIGGLGAGACGSYTVIEIYANSETGIMELATAGKNTGFCGAQYVTDGELFYAIGSYGDCEQCSPTNDVCLYADDLSAAPNCTDLIEAMSVKPLGRTSSVWGEYEATCGAGNGFTGVYEASYYPGGADNVYEMTFTTADYSTTLDPPSRSSESLIGMINC